MNLSIADRLALGGLLPAEGNIIQQTLCRDIANKTRIEQPEMEAIGMTAVDEAGRVRWDKTKENGGMDVPFTDAEIRLLADGVERTDKEGKITMQMLDLCIKIKKEAG